MSKRLAPRAFVQVFFNESPPGTVYGAVELAAASRQKQVLAGLDLRSAAITSDGFAMGRGWMNLKRSARCHRR